MEKISIDKKMLFELIASHSELSQAEYNRNPKYNDEFMSHRIEDIIIGFLSDKNELDNFFIFARDTEG